MKMSKSIDGLRKIVEYLESNLPRHPDLAEQLEFARRQLAACIEQQRLESECRKSIVQPTEEEIEEEINSTRQRLKSRLEAATRMADEAKARWEQACKAVTNYAAAVERDVEPEEAKKRLKESEKYNQLREIVNARWEAWQDALQAISQASVAAVSAMLETGDGGYLFYDSEEQYQIRCREAAARRIQYRQYHRALRDARANRR